MFGPGLGAQRWGSQDSHIAHRSCSVSLLSAMNARRNEASPEGGEAQSSAWRVQALLGRVSICLSHHLEGPRVPEEGKQGWAFRV